MNLECGACQYGFAIDDARLPSGDFKVRCPKCGKLVTGNRMMEQESRSSLNKSPQPENQPEIPEEVEQYVRREIESLRKEFLSSQNAMKVPAKLETFPDEPRESKDWDEKKALLIVDAASMGTFSALVRSRGYMVDIAGSTAEALKQLEVQEFDLIVLDAMMQDDKDGARKIIGRINGAKAEVRRRSFLVLLSPTAKTLDFNAAFLQGVNLVVNKNDLQDFDSHVREGQKYFHRMYQTFRRVSHEKAESPM